MLQHFKLAQFGGINTVLDSTQANGTAARECVNMILRPLGGLGVPAAWIPFAPGGAALDLGFLTNIDFLFDGARLLLEDNAGNWWDMTPQSDGTPKAEVVAAPGVTLSANLAVAEGLVMGFKLNPTTFMQLGADASAAGWFIGRINSAPYWTTRYTADRAFRFGYGPVFAGKWRLAADPVEGLVAVEL
jgi:hypothetical protein